MSTLKEAVEAALREQRSPAAGCHTLDSGGVWIEFHAQVWGDGLGAIVEDLRRRGFDAHVASWEPARVTVRGRL